MERCNSYCPVETPWSTQAKQLSLISRVLHVRTRCTLPLGHRGDHIGPDDSVWISEHTGRKPKSEAGEG